MPTSTYEGGRKRGLTKDVLRLKSKKYSVSEQSVVFGSLAEAFSNLRRHRGPESNRLTPRRLILRERLLRHVTR